MSKMLATCAAVAITAMFALPVPAGAAERNAAGVKQTTDLTDISAQRRYRRGYVRHYYGPRRYYGGPYYAPYRAYGYDPYYRPYYRPGLSVGVGPFGFGFGF
jgi:hypothetical protein